MHAPDGVLVEEEFGEAVGDTVGDTDGAAVGATVEGEPILQTASLSVSELLLLPAELK